MNEYVCREVSDFRDKRDQKIRMDQQKLSLVTPHRPAPNWYGGGEPFVHLEKMIHGKGRCQRTKD